MPPYHLPHDRRRDRPPSGLTWEQFLELLDQDEYKTAELIDGQVVVGTPSWLHQQVVSRLVVLMWQGGHGEATLNWPVRITHSRGYLPDVAWYAEERVPAEGTQPDGPPDLAVEVLSPSTRAFDVVRKRADYARVGVGELWLIDPDGPAALVLRREGAEFVVDADLDVDGELTSPQLPGLAVVSARCWSADPPLRPRARARSGGREHRDRGTGHHLHVAHHVGRRGGRQPHRRGDRPAPVPRPAADAGGGPRRGAPARAGAAAAAAAHPDR